MPVFLLPAAKVTYNIVVCTIHTTTHSSSLQGAMGLIGERGRNGSTGEPGFQVSGNHLLDVVHLVSRTWLVSGGRLCLLGMNHAID